MAAAPDRVGGSPTGPGGLAASGLGPGQPAPQREFDRPASYLRNGPTHSGRRASHPGPCRRGLRGVQETRSRRPSTRCGHRSRPFERPPLRSAGEHHPRALTGGGSIQVFFTRNAYWHSKTVCTTGDHRHTGREVPTRTVAELVGTDIHRCDSGFLSDCLTRLGPAERAVVTGVQSGAIQVDPAAAAAVWFCSWAAAASSAASRSNAFISAFAL